MFEGLGFSFLEPGHHFPPAAARRASTDKIHVGPRRSTTQRRARSDSEALRADKRRTP